MQELLSELESEGVVAPDGADLLGDVTAFLDRFVAFPSEAARDAVALWAVHAHAIEAFESTPRLALLSPEKGSGKTRTLEVLDLIVPTPMHAANLSAAAIFRQVAASQPTLLMDEADTYLGPRVAKDHEDLRGLINAGHRRGAVVYRCVGESSKMEVRAFPAFAACALAGLGDLPDTVLDRALIVRMRRRAPGETVEDFRIRRTRPEGHALRDRIAAWASAHLEVLADAEPEMPAGIVDRPADCWEPLVSIADLCGPEWAERARRACLELNAQRATAEPSLGVQLLADIRTVLEADDKVSTETLIERLCDLEEAPWGDLRGKAIDARGLARRLRPFEIRSRNIRLEDRVAKGYERGDFHDAWLRYLPPSPESPLQALQALQSRSQGVEPVAARDDVADVSATRYASATNDRPTSRDVTYVADVADSGGREAGATGLDRFTFDHDPGPCSACGEPCIPRRGADGVRVHPACDGAA